MPRLRDNVNADTYEVLDFAEAVAAAAGATAEEARKVVAKGSLNIKNGWKKGWEGIAHAPHLPRAITYDTDVLRGVIIRGEIGPDRDKRQAALGNLLEYGSLNNPPNAAGAAALELEQPRFEKALEDLAVKQADTQ